ncbi:protein disulfide [Xylariomycetidae sp. FL2044]|nr:protein disulfide [Xylariomycetidae sp. FL2044]
MAPSAVPASPPVVEFFYDIVCPFAYIASTRIEQIAAQSSATVLWRPVLLGGIYRATSAPQGAEGSATDPFNPTKKAVFRAAFARTLRRLRVPVHQPAAHPRKTVDALRLLHSLPDNGARARASHALFKAYWVDDVDVADRAALLRVTRDALAGMPDDAQQRAVHGAFDDERARKDLEQATAEAIARGAPGVPSFWIPAETWGAGTGEGQEKRGRLYWGQDRLHLVQASLLRLGGALPPVKLRDLLPRCRELKPLDKPAQLEFWFDFSSPWAYLGWTRLEMLQRTFGEKLEIELKPILLGALFKQRVASIGAPMMPVMANSEQRRNYDFQDLHDWTNFWNAVDQQEGCSNEPFSIYWTDHFPLRSPTMLRCAVVNPRVIPVLYRACWALNKNMSDEDVLKDVLTEAGFDAEALLSQARTQPIKDVVIANTAAAKEAGFCGVPTYRVFHRGPGGEWKQTGSPVWGQDGMAVVEDLIAEWDESSPDVLGTSNAPRSRM